MPVRSVAERGEVSTACKDCRGRGVAIHREESVKRGMPVIETASVVVVVAMKDYHQRRYLMLYAR